MSDTLKFDKKCIPCPYYVSVDVINRNDHMEIGDILVPNSSYANDRVAFYRIDEISKEAEEYSGLHKGDYCVGDRLAQVCKTEPRAVIKITNIIAKTNEDNSKFYPMRNMVFVKDDTGKKTDLGGLIVEKKINTGKIVSMNLDEDIKVPYDVGDEVLLVKGGDSFQIGGEHVFIYKWDMIACKVES